MSSGLNQSDFLPDLESCPDGEAKRRATDLAHQLVLLVDEMGDEEDDEKLRSLSREANLVWWEMNAQVG